MINTQSLLNRALEGLDYLGYQLEEMGVTDKVNRHNVMAFIFSEQKNLEGQLESLTARVGNQKARIENLKHEAEQRVSDTIELALSPAKSVMASIRERIS